nr:MAG TPA: hypothetical protein [Bacteriophage sp.]
MFEISVPSRHNFINRGWGLLVSRILPQLSRSNILKNKKAYYIYIYAFIYIYIYIPNN